MSRVSIKGVVVGAVTDILATNLVSIPFLGYVAVQIDLLHLPKAEQTQALMAAVRASVPLYGTLMLAGALCSVLGGYVAARLAKRQEIINGAFSSFLCVASGVWAIASGSSQVPVSQHLLLLAASPLLGAFGGHLRRRQTAKLQAAGTV